jgi:hypothetical protein
MRLEADGRPTPEIALVTALLDSIAVAPATLTKSRRDKELRALELDGRFFNVFSVAALAIQPKPLHHPTFVNLSTVSRRTRG